MDLPFSAEQFFGVFSAYNAALWPVQLLLIGVGAAVPVLASRQRAWRGRATSFVLGSLWIWMALAYHWSFFADINPAARVFGAVFLAQGLLHFWYGFRRAGLVFGLERTWLGYVGGVLVAYGLVLYPLLGLASGRPYPMQPSFGLPCPTTIFTLGVLLWARPKIPWTLLIIPAAWAVVGSSAFRAFGVLEDLALPVSAALGVIALVWQRLRGEPMTAADASGPEKPPVPPVREVPRSRLAH